MPEEFGGGSVSGSPLRDAVIVAEERGRFVQPGPFVATNVVAFAPVRDGSAELQAAYLPDLADRRTHRVVGHQRPQWSTGSPRGAGHRVGRGITP